MKINAVKGFRDILPPETEVWSRLEEDARRIFRAYGYAEIRIPLLERTELFARAAGETSDIVEKQMYTLRGRRRDLAHAPPRGYGFGGSRLHRKWGLRP